MWGSGTVLAQWYLPSSRWPVTFQNTQYKISVKKQYVVVLLSCHLENRKLVFIYWSYCYFSIKQGNQNCEVNKLHSFKKFLPTSRWCNTRGDKRLINVHQQIYMALRKISFAYTDTRSWFQTRIIISRNREVFWVKQEKGVINVRGFLLIQLNTHSSLTVMFVGPNESQERKEESKVDKAYSFTSSRKMVPSLMRV